MSKFCPLIYNEICIKQILKSKVYLCVCLLLTICNAKFTLTKTKPENVLLGNSSSGISNDLLLQPVHLNHQLKLRYLGLFSFDISNQVV